MIELQFIGAARTVTGSKHLLRTSRAQVLFDCGLFQGRRAESDAINRSFGNNGDIDLSSLSAVVLSHAHIDHSGLLPLLPKRGYGGPVYCTPATRDLCVPMLHDTAFIQASDARHIRKLIERGNRDLRPVEPLYDERDVIDLIGLMESVPYHRPFEVAPGVRVTFLDAGHVLGSAIVVIDVEDEGVKRRIAFTGDLGRHHLPILRDPEVPTGVEVLISESTYGDRLHDPIEEMEDRLAEVIKRTFKRGGKVIIPSFALERAQEIIFALKRLQLDGRLPSVPVFLDSPLALKLTEVFKLHPDCYDAETFELLATGDSPFDFPGLRYVSSADDSKAIDVDDRPAVIIAASGMCEAGRVLHHLKATVEDARNTVLIVGFQAQHTLGRRIVERRPEIRIFGVMRPLHAEVVVLNGFSAHADQAGLLAFADAVKARGRLDQVILVHGEAPAQEVLTTKLRERGFTKITAPEPGTVIRL